jgi:hypothetical protein
LDREIDYDRVVAQKGEENSSRGILEFLVDEVEWRVQLSRSAVRYHPYSKRIPESSVLEVQGEREHRDRCRESAPKRHWMDAAPRKPVVDRLHAKQGEPYKHHELERVRLQDFMLC